MFSILIPTFNNIECLKICIKSLKNNSYFTNQIICHVNVGEDGTLNYLRKNNIDFTFTEYNSGICEGINKAAKLATKNYFLYAHDDFYFCPEWDQIILKEIKKIGHNNFYLSGIMMNKGKINFDCGQTSANFNEQKFLTHYKNYNFYDFQGSTWAPTVVHKDIWSSVKGFSEEFFPGSGSDPDFNMKLWKRGIRIFKGVNNFKVYHFGSVVLRDKINKLNKGNKFGSISGKIFLLKWGISIKFFKKFYLQSDTKYVAPLIEPKLSFLFLYKLFLCKIHYLYLKIFYSKLISKNNNKYL